MVSGMYEEVTSGFWQIPMATAECNCQVLELVQQGTQNKTELEDPASVPTNGGNVPNCGMDL